MKSKTNFKDSTLSDITIGWPVGMVSSHCNIIASWQHSVKTNPHHLLQLNFVCLFATGGITPSPSHNTSTDHMTFLGGGTPSPSHNTSTGPMSFLSWLIHIPIIVPLVPGTPYQGLDGVPPSHLGLHGGNWMGYPPVSDWVTPHLGWLYRGQYASCGFPQEDFLVLRQSSVFPNLRYQHCDLLSSCLQ